ncbi:hypothetical protein ACB092_11G238400 [Castanea dentata]
MAEGALFNVAEGIIGQLGNLALKELELLRGVKEEHQKLVGTVSTIKAAILDAEEQQAPNETIKNWLGRLKMHFMKRTTCWMTFPLKFYDGKERLDAIAADRKFHLEERPRETQVSNRARETHHFVRAEDVIGREDDKKYIINRLMDPKIEENVSVLPIVGIGGLGKTTLAQFVFNDEKIKNHFEKKLWVMCKGKKPEKLEMNTLINDLQKEIGGYRYLLVLDDVWNDDSEKWDKLKGLLLGGARGSRILLTTREEKVAKISKAIDPWFLRDLNEEESWSLFKQTAFENGQEPKNLRIKEIGIEIVRKCRGIPLAIKTIGSILYFKNSEEECLFPKGCHIEKNKLIKLWMAQGFIKLSFFQEPIKDEYGNIRVFKIHDFMHDLAKSVAVQESTTLEINKENIVEKTHHVSVGFDLGLSPQIPTFLFKAKRIRTFILPTPRQMIRSLPHSIGKLKHLRYLGLSYNFDIQMLPNSITSLQNLETLNLSSCYGLIELPGNITRLVNLRHLDISYCRKMTHMPYGLGQLTNLQSLSQYVLSTDSRHGELIELQELNGLRENLSIKNLRHETALECDAANLKGKQNLHGLELEWIEGGVDDVDVDRSNSLSQISNFQVQTLSTSQTHQQKQRKNLSSLEIPTPIYASFLDPDQRESKGWGLERIGCREKKSSTCTGASPFQREMERILIPSLKKLEFDGYRGMGYPSWLSSLTNLVELTLSALKNWQRMLLLHQFPSLKTLILSNLPSLEYISNSVNLPSLECLRLFDCPNLKGWIMDSIEEDNDDDNNYVGKSTIKMSTAENHSLPSFSRLSALNIIKCPKLSSMPVFPCIKRLGMVDCDWRPLEQTISKGMIHMESQENPTITGADSSSSTSSTTSSFVPLSKLKSLTIGLKKGDRDRFLQSIRHLTAIDTLAFQYSDEVDLFNNGNGMEWQGLKIIEITDCPNLTTIPEWICNFTSLQSLYRQWCPNLASLPEGMPKSLSTLLILNCPKLLERCKREKGEDWPKIAHIPNLDIYLSEDYSEQTDKKKEPELKTRRLTKILGSCSCSTSQ